MRSSCRVAGRRPSGCQRRSRGLDHQRRLTSHCEPPLTARGYGSDGAGRLEPGRPGAAPRPGPRRRGRPLGRSCRALREAIRAGRLAGASGCRVQGAGRAARRVAGPGGRHATRSSSRRDTCPRLGSGTRWPRGGAGTVAAEPSPRRRRRSMSTSSTACPTSAASRCATGSWALGVGGAAAPSPTSVTSTTPGRRRLRKVRRGLPAAGAGRGRRRRRRGRLPGFRQGLNLVLRALAARGVGPVALEDPGPTTTTRSPGAAGWSRARRGRRQGIDVEALARRRPRRGRDAGAPVPDRRAAARPSAARRWSRGRRRDGVVIEDDYDAEFRYDRQPVGVGAGPGARAGGRDGLRQQDAGADAAARLDRRRRPCARRSLDEKHCSAAAPRPGPAGAGALIESGRYDSTCARCAASTAASEVLVDALAAARPGGRVTGLAAGCHAVLAAARPGSAGAGGRDGRAVGGSTG